MRNVAMWAACLALAGCSTPSLYEQGKSAARAEVEMARKDFGPAADHLLAASIMTPGHHREGKPEEWRKGYEEGIRQGLQAEQDPGSWMLQGGEVGGGSAAP